jgi:hypothetical protein
MAPEILMFHPGGVLSRGFAAAGPEHRRVERPKC